ncbi:AraC family transcriptional regulator [Anaerovorax odorimutans]|uniref:AraC family transcriptional regulator n=2 Tax=Anaerovorax odorimutans TaxID=109327 RepID=A0ABT1RR92_9FIRM|nr:AraC family transcriptional regulator [Anaerovorax odorimutans]MCQ4637717.1 AraC family transcriptional regulator [Anaerovorax odorimutans]
MDWLKRMNEALEYIEDNLDGEIDYAVIARKACCSVYHFQRIFSYMAEVPLSEYIRRRRLSKAAFDLQNTDMRVIDVALKYSYDSPTSFTRAFQKLHGITPIAAREKGALLRAYPPIAFQVSIKGATAMNYKIEEKEAFRIVGFKLSTTMENDACYQEIPKFWGEIAGTGKIGSLGPMINKEPFGMLGVSVCGEPFADSSTFKFDYYIAAPSDQAAADGMDEFIVPAATWAVFECIGPMPGAVQEMQKRIATEWLPTSGYEYGEAPDIEVYYDEDGSKADTRSEIWIPIVKKSDAK